MEFMPVTINRCHIYQVNESWYTSLERKIKESVKKKKRTNSLYTIELTFQGIRTEKYSL